MIIEKLNLDTKDEYQLFGMLYRADLNNSSSKEISNKLDEVVIMVHGCTSSCINNRNDIFADEIMKNSMDYFCFNNRGNGIISKIYKTDGKSVLGGSAYENILEAYFDILAAIDKMIELGYKKIHLLGHSLGCTKIIYTLNKFDNEMKEKYDKYIYDVGFLSLVDIVNSMMEHTTEERVKYAREMCDNGKGKVYMPIESFITLISCDSYLKYVDNSEKYNFVNYIDENYKYEEINRINKSIFLRYADTNEIIPIELEKVLAQVSKNINVNNQYKLDAGFILDTDHSYHKKEKEVINEYIKFIIDNKNN